MQSALAAGSNIRLGFQYSQYTVPEFRSSSFNEERLFSIPTDQRENREIVAHKIRESVRYANCCRARYRKKEPRRTEYVIAQLNGG